MKLLPVTILLFSLFLRVDGQDTVKKKLDRFQNNSVYVEFGGNALLAGSVNYERVLVSGEKYYLAGRGGIGYGKAGSTKLFSAPVQLTNIFQLYNSFALELGLGLTFVQAHRFEDTQAWDWEYDNLTVLVPVFGIRYQDSEGKAGFLFRLDFTPLYSMSTEDNVLPSKRFVPWLGISFGVGFGKKK